MGDVIIKVSHKIHYGKDLFYPENEPAKALTEMAGIKSFTKFQIEKLKAAGLKIELVVPGFEDLFGG